MGDQIRGDIVKHIFDNAQQKGIFIDHLNGYQEHFHSLFSLGGKQSISDIMQAVKGESSYWINKNRLTRLKFEWQDDYYAVSIGMNQIDTLRKYIRNQAQHHKKESWEDEIDKLIDEYKLERFRD
jgi:REP element-mobilizing transposase RayT